MNKKNKLFLLVFFYVVSSKAGTLELEWQNYTSEPALKTQLEDYLILKWDQKADFNFGDFYFDSHIQAEYNLDKSKMFYFNIPELYFFYEYTLNRSIYSIKSVELIVGRKIKDWNLADEYWDMGLWNPLNRWNPLHPKSNGLVGSFLNFKAEKWSLDFLVGALYLPNREVQLITKGGEIYSNSRWFSLLPDQVELGQSYIDIRYLTESPFIFDVLFQQSYLLSVKTWSKKAGAYYWIKLSVADKPVNHLFYVKNKTVYTIGKEEGAEGEIWQTITSLPVRQRLLSVEWGVDYNSLSSTFTLGNTKMKEVDISPEGWDFLNRRENFTYFSTLLKYNFSPKHFVQFGYLQSWFQNYNIQADDSKKGKPPSVLNRYKLLNGVSFDWQKELSSSSGLSRTVALNYRYSFLNQGAWLFFKALYYITPNIYTSLTFDILGAEKEGNYFLNQFGHNDYFSWRLAYEYKF